MTSQRHHKRKRDKRTETPSLQIFGSNESAARFLDKRVCACHCLHASKKNAQHAILAPKRRSRHSLLNFPLYHSTLRPGILAKKTFLACTRGTGAKCQQRVGSKVGSPSAPMHVFTKTIETMSLHVSTKHLHTGAFSRGTKSCFVPGQMRTVEPTTFMLT